MKTVARKRLVDSTDTELLGVHPRIKEILAQIKRIGPTDGRVLISGESGTGKELIARSIHANSRRNHKPMIKINCAAIPSSLMESELFGHERGAFTGASKSRKGVFERADGGTLFLDEIGELDLRIQAKLLRVLQNGEFQRVGGETTIVTDVRIIAATNRSLEGLVKIGAFREDLFHRLNVLQIHTIPLREMRSDIKDIANFFLGQMTKQHALSEKLLSKNAIMQLETYEWPGNVRELRNTIERVAILSDQRVIDDIPNLSRKALAPHPKERGLASESMNASNSFHFSQKIQKWSQIQDTFARQYLYFVMTSTQGNISEAARILDIERAYLHRLIKKHGLIAGQRPTKKTSKS